MLPWAFLPSRACCRAPCLCLYTGSSHVLGGCRGANRTSTRTSEYRSTPDWPAPFTRTNRTLGPDSPLRVSAPFRTWRSSRWRPGLWVHLADGPPLPRTLDCSLGYLPDFAGADRTEVWCQANATSWPRMKYTRRFGRSKASMAAGQNSQAFFSRLRAPRHAQSPARPERPRLQ